MRHYFHHLLMSMQFFTSLKAAASLVFSFADLPLCTCCGNPPSSCIVTTAVKSRLQKFCDFIPTSPFHSIFLFLSPFPLLISCSFFFVSLSSPFSSFLLPLSSFFDLFYSYFAALQISFTHSLIFYLKIFK